MNEIERLKRAAIENPYPWERMAATTTLAAYGTEALPALSEVAERAPYSLERVYAMNYVLSIRKVNRIKEILF